MNLPYPGHEMKTWKQHYQEFADYCHTLTDSQLENVIAGERERSENNPDDECFDACYQAAKTERTIRGE